jgi:hypothetical protein
MHRHTCICGPDTRNVDIPAKAVLRTFHQVAWRSFLWTLVPETVECFLRIAIRLPHRAVLAPPSNSIPPNSKFKRSSYQVLTLLHIRVCNILPQNCLSALSEWGYLTSGLSPWNCCCRVPYRAQLRVCHHRLSCLSGRCTSVCCTNKTCLHLGLQRAFHCRSARKPHKKHITPLAIWI